MRINEPINDLHPLLCLAMQRICYPLQNECQGLKPKKMNNRLIAVSDAADMF